MFFSFNSLSNIDDLAICCVLKYAYAQPSKSDYKEN